MYDKMESPLIDVVVPVYNAAAYLERCVRSIEEQTYASVHIIMINDGSTDESLSVMRGLAEQYRNIDVYDQENHGVGYVRNRALSLLKGEYVAFVDADDTIARDFLELLYKALSSSGSDIAVSTYISSESFSLLEKIKWELNTDQIDTFFERNVIDNCLYYCVTNKLFSKDFLIKSNAWFSEKLNFGEDLLFLITLYLKQPKIIVEKKAVYYYTYNDQSITKKPNPKRCYEQFRVFTTLLEHHTDSQFAASVLCGELFWMFGISGAILSVREGAGKETLVEYCSEIMRYAEKSGMRKGQLISAAIRWGNIEGKCLPGKLKLIAMMSCMLLRQWPCVSLLLGQK